MKPDQFCYWLQGLFEVGNPKTLNEKQIQVIKNHLNLVFYHEIDKSYKFNQEQMDEAQKIHDGKSSLSGPPASLPLTCGYYPNKTGENPEAHSSYTITKTGEHKVDPGKIMLRC